MPFENMDDYISEFSKLLKKHNKITILSHVNPDPDAIGTALGIYTWLKEQGYRAEVANITEDVPRVLDFLPNFSKLKRKIDLNDSLIISCDCGSLDRLGFDVIGRDIVNIDHHLSNTMFGSLNIVIPEAVSSSEVAYRLLKPLGGISRESAVSFYAALVSDTRNFTTNNVDDRAFGFASELVRLGVNVAEVSQKMLHRRSLASLRILGVAISSLELRENARIALLKITQDDIAKTGAKYSDLDGVVDYARSLATVEIAIMLVERKNGIKVSLRSKQSDVSGLAEEFGGGGHMVAGGFEEAGSDMEGLSERLMDAIVKGGFIK